MSVIKFPAQNSSFEDAISICLLFVGSMYTNMHFLFQSVDTDMLTTPVKCYYILLRKYRFLLPPRQA